MTEDQERKLDEYVQRIVSGEILSESDRKHYDALCNEWLDEEDAKHIRARLGEFI